MKKNYSQYFAVFSILFLLSGLSFTASSQVIKPFKERTSSYSPTKTIYKIKGNFTMMGNTNLTLQNYAVDRTNGTNAMVYVDKDSDNQTHNSSSATLDLLSDSGAKLTNCYNIVYAGLYWTGRVSDANNSPNTFSVTKNGVTKTLDKRKILFKGPLDSTYDEFTATDIYFPTNADNNMFTAYAEVTDYVRTNGVGEYFAANIAATEGSDGGAIGKYAGWGLVVIYENSNMKNRDITVFDGHAFVQNSVTANYTIPVSGFNSVASGPVGIKLGVMAGEGDVNYDGDYFQIQRLNTNNYLSLSRTGNSTNNFFNSSISTGGNSRNPNLVNNSGIDISMFDLPNSAKDIIGNNQTSTTFKYGSTVDTYSIFSIVMAVDAYVPEIEGVLTATTINGSAAGAGPYTVLPGQELGYKLQIKNRGSEAIQNSKIVIPIPYNATFVTGSLAKTVNFTPAPTPNSLTYEPTIGANGSIVWDLGTLPLPSDPNTVLAELTFKLKSTENCALLKNTNCSNIIQVNGLLSGKGINSGVTVTDKSFILGYTSSGSCTGTAISAPLQTTINATNYTNANCQATSPDIAFTFCNGASSIPITDVTGSFPPGSTFYNAYPVVAGSTTQYTINNPFPATVGTSTYYAIPPGATGGCYFQFTINIESITTTPTVTTPINYCVGDVAVQLTATPTKPEYVLYYYETATSTGQQSITPSTSTVGQFTYYVAEGKTNACIGPKKAIVVNVYAKPTVVINNPLPICFPETTFDLSQSSVTSGSTSGLTFTYWQDEAATIPLTDYTAATYGTYYIKGTNQTTNCFDVKPITLTKSHVGIIEVLSAHVDVACKGEFTGAITVNDAHSGVGPYTYSWNKNSMPFNQTSQTLTNLGAGIYELTATDSNGCWGTLVITITEPNEVMALAASSKTDITCYGASTGTVTAGAVTNAVGTVNYSWKNSSNVEVGTSASVSNLPAGTYTLTVTDDCSSQTNSVTIDQPAAALALTASSKTDITCYGASTGTVTAGTVTNAVGTVNYSWKNSSNVEVGTSASVSNLPAGTYTLTVTDDCSSQNNSVTIDQPAAALALATSSKTDITCYGASTGTVTAGTVTNAVGTVNYSWKNSSNVEVGTSASVSNLPAGTYTLTVTDDCSSQNNSVTIDQPAAALALATSSKTDITCYGVSTGTVTAGTVTNAVGTVNYSWKNSSNVEVGTSASVANLPAGTYTLTVTDDCSSQNNSVTIDQPAAALALATSSKTDITCYGASTGTVTAGAVTNAVGTVNYSWKNSSNVEVGTSAFVSNLPAGTYTLTVTDDCSSQTNSVTIDQPAAALALTASSKTDISCYGASTGTVTAGAVTNAVGTVNYSWKNSSNVEVGTSASVSNLPAGTYTLTVTDDCSSQTNSVTIDQPAAALTCSIVQDKPVTSNGLSNGEATVTAIGGNGNYTYLWDNNETTPTAIGLSAGVHSVTVTDSKGCTTSCTVTITEPNVLSCSISQDSPVQCFGENTGKGTVTAVGGNGDYTYLWDNGETTAQAIALSAGLHNVTVTDKLGYNTSCSVTISQPQNALNAVKTQTDVTCGGGNNGSATVTVSGGTPAYTYSWNSTPLQTSATATNLMAGNYTVTITDANGCTISESFTILDGDSIKPIVDALPETTTINCPSEPVFSQATATDNNGTISALTYVDNIVQGNCEGSYTKTRTWTATDACGNISLPVSQTIIVQDITAPTWTTQAGTLNQTIECSDASALANAQLLFPAASDSCDADVTNIVKVSGSFVADAGCANAGTYTNTWTVKDDCGNTSDTFTQIITIQDTTAPTWTTQAGTLNQTIECSDASALANAQLLFPAASDSCDADVTNIVKVSGSFVADAGCANAGTYTNTWTVKDDCGNTSDTFTQIITIQDTTAPTWTTQAGTLNQTIECSDASALANAQLLFPAASDSCDADVTNIVKVSGSFVADAGCANAGTYTNKWTVKDDCGNTSDTFTQIITIQDTTAPTWTTQAGTLNQTIECSDANALANAQLLFPAASDSCDADVTNIVKVSGSFVADAGCANAGTYTNTWTVKDDCGNTSDTFTQIITIQDTTAPMFTGILPLDIEVSCDAIPEPAEMYASDNCNGDLPIVFSEVKSNIVNGCTSNYTLTRTWKTSDCAGNSASYTQIITVQDKTAPTGTAPANINNLASIDLIPLGSSSDITNAIDNCSPTVDITVSDSNNGGSGCEGSPYILTRTYTLTDCSGNKTELTQTFTIENKVSVSGIATNVTCFGGQDGSIIITNSPGSTVVITNDKNEVVGNTNLPAGTYTLTATVNGNNQTCSATTTVVIEQPQYTVKISGQIINIDNNTPIANVPVTLVPQGTTTGPILMRITGADGMYSFSGMAAGSYLVQVQDANLNSAYQLYPIDSSLFFTTLQDCAFQTHNFEYGASTLPVLGDYVWYDTNSNGIQDEWYDANNDGIVTKNIPDANGAVDYSQWEWIDLNGDGSYTGSQNIGELNAGGFGNALNANVIIDGPNGYHEEVVVGIEGFWRDRPNAANPYGQYTIKLLRDANFDAVASTLGATGLVKVLPSLADKKVNTKTGKAQLHTVCKTTTESGYIVNVTPQDLVHLDADFGVSCKEYKDIIANDDSAGPFAGVNHTTTNVLNVFSNDTLEGITVTPSDVILTTVTPNDYLQLNPDGSVDILPNAPVGTLTLVYQICEADQTDNCDTATVTITIEAPVMTVTATAICVNDVPYLDYVVSPVNFTPANGVTITWADSNNNIVTTMTDLPLSGRVLWPGAIVDGEGKGIDWPGWIFENNKWIQGADGFESLRPTANITVSLNPSETITVNYPPSDPYCTSRPTFAIVANDDTAGPINGITGGTNVINIFTNDTLNGSAVNANDVTLTTVVPDPTGTIILNADGSINIPVNTPAGTYTLTYQICEKTDFGNCDTAIVTITVVTPTPPALIVANDDIYNNIGCNSFGLVGNVLSNDLVGTSPATLELVNFTLLSENNNAKTDPNITIDVSGNVNVSSLTPAGTYTYSYRICEKLNPENCDTAIVTITVIPNGITEISNTSCTDDSSLIDLTTLLPEGSPITGTWIDKSNTNTLQGSVFNPFGLALGNYAFEYLIADETCPRSILLNMEVNDDCRVLPCGDVLVHNSFSPNGDGMNDFFKIDNIDDTTCYPGNTVQIYNRWGILVFETTNYNNTTNAFDGTSRGRTTVKQSEGLPTGTYFYIINYKSLDTNNNVQENKLDGYLYLSK